MAQRMSWQLLLQFLLQFATILVQVALTSAFASHHNASGLQITRKCQGKRTDLQNAAAMITSDANIMAIAAAIPATVCNDLGAGGYHVCIAALCR